MIKFSMAELKRRLVRQADRGEVVMARADFRKSRDDPPLPHKHSMSRVLVTSATILSLIGMLTALFAVATVTFGAV